MKHYRLVAAALGCSFASAVSPVQGAGGHYAVDDTELAPAGSCQVELWYAHFNAGNENATVAPACNPTGNLELMAELNRVREAGELETELALAAKTRLYEMEAAAVALSVAGVHSHDAGEFDALQVLMPVSVDMGRVTTHYNLGWQRERGEAHHMLWGVAAEIPLAQRVSLIGETYGSHRGGTRLGGGLRYSLDQLDIDLAWDGARHNATPGDGVIMGMAMRF